MNNDMSYDEDEKILCDECEHAVSSEDDLYPYEDMNVCLKCQDKLRLQDEQRVIEWETEEYGEYDS
jgi:hypothetical protein